MVFKAGGRRGGKMAETKLVVPLSKLVSSNTFNYITIVAFKYRIDVLPLSSTVPF